MTRVFKLTKEEAAVPCFDTELDSLASFPHIRNGHRCRDLREHNRVVVSRSPASLNCFCWRGALSENRLIFADQNYDPQSSEVIRDLGKVDIRYHLDCHAGRPPGLIILYGPWKAIIQLDVYRKILKQQESK